MKHQHKHSGESPHVCKVCNMAFIEKNSLIRHQPIHIRWRPYSGEVCNYALSTVRSDKTSMHTLVLSALILVMCVIKIQ
jgi:KRAB domain-containing zinc finger protein